MKVKILECPRRFAWYVDLFLSQKTIEVKVAERTSQMDIDEWYILEEDYEKYLDPRIKVATKTKLRWVRARYCEKQSENKQNETIKRTD